MNDLIEYQPPTETYTGTSNTTIIPSQVHNFWSFFRSISLALFLIWVFTSLPAKWGTHYFLLAFCLSLIALQALWRWADLRCLSYRFDEERVVWTRGIFSRNSGSLEMFRIQTITMNQGFIERLLGVGSVLLETQDPTNPYVRLIGMKRPDIWREWLTIHVQRARRARGFREFAIG